ncbi:anhydro-N-acetylmuramic acid kinase [Acidihalobacter ferrooxydans]|uniref:Anhydro-N-acetylmuramic acid kinase n=1 Tax=Acidihalobacter ferrooxydans TaxID=1765967 RepID=A0A1P8UK11_9GAMM|nr:anhydro-N-acetylmuramic acid kinase [Acidihalobacter ferrooxydans]APZ44168.1 anhydro-N-acetylmuramic acid kinase [Acidihalobacter ferrooxydans]
MKELFLGLMSGTSLDGIDTCIAAFDPQFEIVGTHKGDLPDDLRRELIALIHDTSPDRRGMLARIGELDARLGELFAQTVLDALEQHAIPSTAIRAIGSHGQTVWHQPLGAYPFSLQIGDAARIAERTNITTVADFRRRDIAAGGQGAPLVPAFHAAMFQTPTEARAVVNIGGMANITLLPPSEDTASVSGFDTGPGNILLDIHIQRYRASAYDQDGAFAASGDCDEALLDVLLHDPYFALPPPKSTGREHFNAAWLDQHLNNPRLSPADVQATLTEFTARSIAAAVDTYFSHCQRLLICGGGAHNNELIRRLSANLRSTCVIESTSAYGIEPDWIEASAFAWLARQTLLLRPGNLPRVTGASKSVILGAIHPASSPYQ